MRPNATQSSPRTITVTNSEGAGLLDSDGIATSIAGATSAASYDGGDFDGAYAPGTGPAIMDPPMYVKLTTSAHVGAYSTTSPVVITGTYGGKPVTESIQPTQANGNEQLVGNQPFDTVTGIDIPAQPNATGTFTFGVSGIACKQVNGAANPYRAIVVNTPAGGTVKLGYLSHAPGYVDSLPCAYSVEKAVEPFRVYSSGTDNALGLTLYE